MPSPDTAIAPATTPLSPTPARSRTGVVLLAVGLLVIGLNLRIAVAAVGPLMSQIRADLGLNAAVTSLLTTIPVLTFGLFAFFTPTLIKRLGMHRLLGYTMITLAVGIVVRLEPSLTALFLGTVIIGAAIAVANVVMPAAIKRDFTSSQGLMMGLYSTALFVGAAAASGLTVPLLHATGEQWRPTLALWAIPAVVALALWLPQMRQRTTPGSTSASSRPGSGEPSFRAMFQDPIALAVTAFMGLQSMSYYAVLTWVPTLLEDHGMDATQAGWMMSFSAFPGILASLVTPALARKARWTWLPVLVVLVLSAVGYAGLIIAPVEGAYLWMLLLGLGQGATISLALSYIVWRSPDAAHTGHLSTMAQGTGYLFAALGPLGIGALHSLTGGWLIPVLALLVMLVLQTLVAIPASRDRHILQ